MDAKLMHVYPQKCTACRNCELACSFSRVCQGRPATARIRAVPDADGRESMHTVVVCMQCEEAGCVAACPARALWRDPATGAVHHVAQRCIRCASCVAACPFGNMRWETQAQYPSKCDLCGGDPVCVKFCPTGAITYR